MSNSWSCTEESKGTTTGISGLRGSLEMLLVGHGTSGKLFNPQCSPSVQQEKLLSPSELCGICEGMQVRRFMIRTQ